MLQKASPRGLRRPLPLKNIFSKACIYAISFLYLLKLLPLQPCVRVIIADSHRLSRKIYTGILDETTGLKAAMANDEKELYAALEQHPDTQLIIMEMRLPLAHHGIEICRHLRNHYPHIGIIIITTCVQKPLMRQVHDAGPHGYLIKGRAEEEEIKEAIHRVMAGGTYYCKEFTPLLTGDKNRLAISEEQKQLIRMICTGIKSFLIAGQFCRSSHAINKRRAKLMKDLGLSSLIELIQLALREGIIDWSHLFE